MKLVPRQELLGNDYKEVFARLHAKCPAHQAEMDRIFAEWLKEMGTPAGQELLDEYRRLLRAELAMRDLNQAQARKLATRKHGACTPPECR